ncbi:MAG: arginine--tRNA ligase [Candidatus Zixiibacteriota bacterium]
MITALPLKHQFARAVAEAFKKQYPALLTQDAAAALFNESDILNSLEKPKDPRMGRFAYPIFKHMSLLKGNPAEITARIAAEATRFAETAFPGSPVSFKGAGGYINGVVEPVSLVNSTLKAVLIGKNQYGNSDAGNGLKVLVEYSSPNIAKPFGVGHLRSTIIGNSLRRIFKKLGYDVTGINYPGDWGTQFGKMIVAYQKWGSPATLEGNAVKNLLALYVKFHEEADRDATLNQAARDAFKRLESNDPTAVALWEQFKKISRAEFDRVYGILGVEFDLTYGESFLNDKMEPLVDRLQKDGLTSISQGALVVDLNDPQLPPALLKKGDGATLYITRDIAGMVYRWETFKFHKSLYVVGSSQADHFRQCLKVVHLMEEAEKLPPEKRMSGRIEHVDFGWVKFGDKTMSTRRGNIVFLEDVINEAVSLAKEKIREKNPDLADLDEVAQMIGVGAVMFSQLSVRRVKDVNFVWEDVLTFDGETGPYLQYTHARLCSLERNYGKPITPDFDPALLTGEEEQRVIEILADFSEAIEDAARINDPVQISNYLLKLSGAFNKFYQRKDAAGRIDKIISENEKLSAARMSLVCAVRIVMHEGLYLLGLRAPQEM